MLLVTGANGHFAGAAIRYLREILGPGVPFAATTRDDESASAQALARDGIGVRRANFDDTPGLIRAFQGIERLLLVSIVAPNAERVRLHKNAVAAAQAAGVPHVIYTSFINASPDSLTEHSRMVHYPTEQALIQSGLRYTILRHSVYADAVLDDIQETLRTGQFSRPGRAPCAYAVRDDLAFAAATVLAHGGHEGRIFTETMAEALTAEQVASLMSEVFARPIVFNELTFEQWPAYMQRVMGVPDSVAQSSIGTLRALAAGEFSTVTRDYERLVSRAPTTFREFLQAHANSRRVR